MANEKPTQKESNFTKTIQNQPKALKLSIISKRIPKINRITQILVWTQLLPLTLTVGYKFQEPFSSKLKSIRRAHQGPVKEYFSLCTSITECKILNKDKVIQTVSKLNAAYSYSSPIVNRTLISGFNTKLILFNTTNKKPQIIASNPPQILRCVFTKGIAWLCISGINGQYFLYDVIANRPIINYEVRISNTLKKVTNHGCAILAPKQTLYCAFIDKNTQNRILDLRSANMGGFKEYKGNITIPSNPVGVSTNRGIIALYSVNPLKVRISNYSSGKLLKSWDKPGITADKNFTVADMSEGLILASNNTGSQIFDLANGTSYKKLNAETAQFSDTGDIIYFKDRSKKNQVSYLKYTKPPKPPLCASYHYGINKCVACIRGYNLLSKGTCKKDQNYIPGGIEGDFLNSSTYYFTFDETCTSRAYIDFTTLRSLDSVSKKKFIEKFLSNIKNPPFNARVIIEHIKDKSWKKDEFLIFKPLNFTAMWERGILPMQIDHVQDNERIEGRIGFLKAVKNSTAKNGTKKLPKGLKSDNNKKRRILKKIKWPEKTNEVSFDGRGGSRRLLVSLDGNHQKAVIPAFWKPSKTFEVIIRLFTDLISIIIDILQIFLTFIRPIFPDLRRNKWSAWLASSLHFFQIFLLLGGISGNFGGVIDMIQINKLKSFQKNFFVNTEFNLSQEFRRLGRGITFGKFSVADYTFSPIQETFWPLIILVASIITEGLSLFIPELRYFGKAFRVGASLSFMIPLLTASLSCLFVILYANISQVFGVFSMIVSILLVVYFIIELIFSLNSFTRLNAVNFENKDAFQLAYQEMRADTELRMFDIDTNVKIVNINSLNYFEIVTSFLFPFVLIGMVFGRIGSPLSSLLLFIPLLAFVVYITQKTFEATEITPIASRDRTLSYINSLKSASLGLRILYLIILVTFWGVLHYNSLVWTQIPTIFAVMLLFLDFVVNLIILGMRILNFDNYRYKNPTTMAPNQGGTKQAPSRRDTPKSPVETERMPFPQLETQPKVNPPSFVQYSGYVPRVPVNIVRPPRQGTLGTGGRSPVRPGIAQPVVIPRTATVNPSGGFSFPPRYRSPERSGGGGQFAVNKIPY